MKIKILLLLIVVLVSCKKEVKEPNFEMTSERNVDIPISSEAKLALKKLSSISIDDNSICQNKLGKEYKVDFYFKINETSKDLIIIEYFNNICSDGDDVLNRKISKYVIPIQKIGDIDIQDFDGHFTHTDKRNSSLFITMDYNANSIKKESIEAFGRNENRTYFNGNSELSYIILEVPKEIGLKTQYNIEVLKAEFKL